MSDDDRTEPEPDGPILVIDDDPHLREALARILQSEGHQVLTAEDGATAVALTKAHAPGLLVLDSTLPGVDGGTVMGALREALSDEVPPTLLLTAGERSAPDRERAGVVEDLEKPFNVPELLEAVQRYRRKTARERS